MEGEETDGALLVVAEQEEDELFAVAPPANMNPGILTLELLY